MITTTNHGPLVASSTYWGSHQEAEGYLYMTPNSGAFRLLLPRKFEGVEEMRTAKECVITIGRAYNNKGLLTPQLIGKQAAEVMFEDHSQSPYTIYIALEQWERLPAEEDYGKWFELTVWEDRRGKPHRILSRPCYLRKGKLQDMSPVPNSKP